MRKLIAVGILLGGLLSGAGSAMAGGLADPLTLAASGVMIPYITGTTGGQVALIEIASPVAANPNLHMLFYNSTCQRVGDSVGIPETINDVAFQDVFVAIGAAPGFDGAGLVTIAGVDATGFNLRPLDAPIHSRIYHFNTANGRSTIQEPITLDTAECPSPACAAATAADAMQWNGLRTAATFYAPMETALVHTELTLICPRKTIQGANVATDAFPTTWFPTIVPPFKTSPASTNDDMRARVYDTTEVLKRDVRFTCDCLTVKGVLSISSFYGLAPEAALGTYTELEVTDPPPGGGSPVGSFLGFKSNSTVGSALNNFFGRLSNGSRSAIQGVVVPNAR